MKVNLKKYKHLPKPDWVYDLPFVGKRINKLLVRLEIFINRNKDKVKVEPWDSWNVDQTLALIIHPLLVQYQATKHGSPFVDDEDVPEELRSYNSKKKKEEEYDTDEFFHQRWDYVIDCMIYSFKAVLDDDDFFTKSKEEIIEEDKKIKKGLILFGKYYRNIWD